MTNHPTQPDHPIVTPPAADTPELRHTVLRICRRMAELGLCLGTWGNVSVRVAAGLLVTPTRVAYDTMQPEDLVVVSWEGKPVSGRRLPTSESHLHRLVLLARPDMGALIHSHAPWSSTLAMAGRGLPCIAEDMAQIIGDSVQCSAYLSSAQHIPFAETARQAMGPRAMAALLANHGVIVGGRDLDEALVATQILEKSVMMFIQAAAIGGAKALTPEQIAHERYRYLFKYGTAADAAGTVGA